MTFITVIKHALLSGPDTDSLYYQPLKSQYESDLGGFSLGLWENFRGHRGGGRSLVVSSCGRNACASDLLLKTHFDFSSLFSLMTLITMSLTGPSRVTQTGQSGENLPIKAGESMCLSRLCVL